MGCSTATKLGSLPTKEYEYNLPKSELIQRYPTIDKYETHWKTKLDYKQEYYDPSGLSELVAPLFKDKENIEYLEGPDQSSLPLKQDVLNSLGEPYRIKGGYGGHFLIAGVFLLLGIEPIYAVSGPFILYPDRKREYHFEKGNYCISTYFERSPKTFYKSLMTSWEWKEKNKKDVKCN